MEDLCVWYESFDLVRFWTKCKQRNFFRGMVVVEGDHRKDVAALRLFLLVARQIEPIGVVRRKDDEGILACLLHR